MDENYGVYIIIISLIIVAAIFGYANGDNNITQDVPTEDDFWRAIDSLPYNHGDYVVSTKEFNDTFNTSVYGKITSIGIYDGDITILEYGSEFSTCKRITYMVINDEEYKLISGYDNSTCSLVESNIYWFEAIGDDTDAHAQPPHAVNDGRG